jgi:histone acetyltransferase (RNA polymerase elongator complex component)
MSDSIETEPEWDPNSIVMDSVQYSTVKVEIGVSLNNP